MKLKLPTIFKNKNKTPERTIINKKTFQLIGPNGEKSKEINLKQTSKKKLSEMSNFVVKSGLSPVNWRHKGTKECMFDKSSTAKNSRLKFIEYLKQNPKKNKQVLIVGPAKGYETELIKKNIPKTTIDTFDIINEIEDVHKKNISNQITYKKGLENYNNPEMIGKYDGITAVFSAGWHTNYPERNLLKIALMLKPGGVAVIVVQNPTITHSALTEIFKRYKLDSLYNLKVIGKVELGNLDIIIERK